MSAATIVTSIVTGGSNNAATTSEQANAVATDFVSQGIVGALGNTSGVAPATGGFAVNQDSSPDMGVTVAAGVAYITATPTSQSSQVMRAKMSANYTAYTINANASGSTKYDWIYLSVSATNAANPAVGADNVTSLFTSRSTSISTDTGTPPTYGILLAVVTVANGASSITNANISDRRTQTTLSNGSQSNTDGWQVLNYPLTYSANNGSKEFVVTSANDLTSVLSVGMKLRITRSVTPPTQCMSFAAASSQYATKASPSGISFTGAFTCEAWVYLNSYQAGNQWIINRTDQGTSGGWGFNIDSTGRVRIIYGSGSNFTDITTYQSLPLSRWVHVAGVITSVASKTGAVYINGASVPTTSTLTAATSLAQQTVDLRVGARSGTAAQYLDGYLSEVRVWSTNRSTQNIQDNMAVSLTGSESNLVALYQGNGAFTDGTSNANTLTANNGAIATQSANPYNSNEYAIITKISYSNPTTTVTLFAGTGNMVPNQTLNNPYYSTAKLPFGFPGQIGRWKIDAIYRNNLGQASPTVNIWYNPNTSLAIPTGEWRAGYEAPIAELGSSSTLACQVTLSTANNSESNTMLSAETVAASVTQLTQSVKRDEDISLTSLTTNYLNIRYIAGTSVTTINVQGGDVSGVIKAYCTYV